MQQVLILGKDFGDEAEMDIKLSNWYKKLLQCMERRRQRHQLLRLDDRMLSDIGISRANAMKEASKRCWRE